MAQYSPIPRTPVKEYSVTLPEELATLVETIAEFMYISPSNFIAQVMEREVKHYNTGRMDLTNRMRHDSDRKWNRSAR